MKRNFVLLCLSLTLLMAGSSSSADVNYPGEFQSAEKAIAAWMSQWKGKSQRQVEGQLGAPVERSTWDFQGAKPPKLLYKTPGKGRLELYFIEDRVITVSFQLITD